MLRDFHDIARLARVRVWLLICGCSMRNFVYWLVPNDWPECCLHNATRHLSLDFWRESKSKRAPSSSAIIYSCHGAVAPTVNT